MITTTTYRDHVGTRRDLLAAFSALDHSTTARLSDGELAAAYERLLARIAALLSLHGPEVPAAFLTALAAGNGDAVAVTATFLETGRAGPEVDVSELQQELVHFSRIVDLDRTGLPEVAPAGVADPLARQAARRLRNSQRLPTGLKTLSELMIVTRARLATRGAKVEQPYLRGAAPEHTSLDAETSTWTGPDYTLLAASPRRRTVAQAGYLFTALLQYLTPVEAAAALWAYAIEEPPRRWLDLATAQVGSEGVVTTVAWTHAGRGSEGLGRSSAGGGHSTEEHDGEQAAAWLLGRLPIWRAGARGQALDQPTAHGTAITVKAMQPGALADGIGVGGGGAGRSVLATLSDRSQVTHHVKLTAPGQAGTASVDAMVAEVDRRLAGYHGPPVASIECGHIHLDRDLDIDQEVGAVLGQHARQLLQRRFGAAPVLTPMMDDDHVLVKLRPSQYRAFLSTVFADAPMHLIAESSPIIRSIVTAMWARLTERGLGERLRERGENLFLQLGDGGWCELFERYGAGDGQPGPAATGCVFFETALLTYRCDPARFDGYFADRFDMDVHEEIAHILDSTNGYDEATAALGAFYRRFAVVTDPRNPDASITDLVTEVLDSAAAAGRVAHLNVLEDYYEVQQHKVRALLKLLDLPVYLLTVHFNTQTGRVVFDGHDQ